MKTFIVVSAVGKDRPGFVNRIAHTVKEIGGNIEMQRSTRMAADFAVITLFSLGEGAVSVDTAIEKLRELNAEKMLVTAREALSEPADRDDGAAGAELIASGADQPGIIDAVTLTLFREHINIESMDYDVEHAPMTGEHLFRMTARLAVPQTVNLEQLRERLREMEEDLNFDILLRYPVE